MKKKIFSALLSIAFVLCAATFVTACGEKHSPVEVTIGSETFEYQTLAEAVVTEATTDVIEITLYQDLVLTSNFHITTNEYVINLNGYDVSFPTDENGDGIFWVEGTAKLTINGNGVVNSASQENDYSMAVWANNGGEVVINGGTFTNVGAKAYEDDGTTRNNNEVIYASRAGVITINGGKFIGNYENVGFGTRFTLNQKDENTSTAAIEAGTVIVKGGEYRQFDPANSLSENPAGNFVAEGYVSTLDTRDGINWYVVTVEND